MTFYPRYNTGRYRKPGRKVGEQKTGNREFMGEDGVVHAESDEERI